MVINLSETSIKGLKLLNSSEVSEEMTKKLITNAVKQLLKSPAGKIRNC